MSELTISKLQEKKRAQEIVFDPVLTLMVIREVHGLHEIYDKSADIDMLIISAKNKLLNEKSLNRLSEIFERIIKVNSAPLRIYKKLIIAEGIVENSPKIVEGPAKKLSKHYGKKRILADIAANNNIKTELDETMLALNSMRNLYAKLKRRGVKAKSKGEGVLTNQDCRFIIATVRTLEKRINKIVKRKK
jgi:hypothetical protein